LTYLVAALEEIAVADMVALLARRELGHGVVVEREVVEQPVRLVVQLLCHVLGESIRDEQVSIRVPELELLFGEAG
jgi:hypothetical protein